MTTQHDQNRWRARPVLAAVVRGTILAIPLVAASAWVHLVGRLLPDGAGRTWWGLTTMLVTAVVVAVVVERGARRLLPLAVLLKLSMLFPDRAPSRLRLTRTAAQRQPRAELLWNGSAARPTTTADLVLDLVTALGAHDRRTRGHSERVRLLCDMLGDELKLDQDDRDRLRWAALLHDVGKMSVSAAILNKPAKLDAREFDRIKQHPQAGAELAAPLLPWLGPWGEGILDHHEKYDGSGYPNGKAGTDISAAGRLIAVVDAFETMTAARAYKKAMATRAAREELARCAGTHFDPVYVRAFLAISLPRVLWAMGPLSFVFQLPFLRPLAQAGARTTSVGTATTAAVAGAAGAAVLAAGSVAAVGDATGYLDLGTPRPLVPAAAAEERRPPAVAEPAATSRPEPAPAPATTAPAPTTPPEPAPRSRTEPAVEPEPAPAATATASPRPRGALPTVRPTRATDRPGTGPAAPEEPVEEEPTDPVEEEPTDPVEEEPTDPVDEPTDPVEEEPTDPVEEEPTDPVDEPTDPVEEEPTDPGTAPTVPGTGPAIVSGPVSPTTATTATFELTTGPDAQWECQLPRNTSGESSRWQPCSGTLTVQVTRTGENELRVRDAVTGAQVDSWTWVVTAPAQGRPVPEHVDDAAAPAPARDPLPAPALLALLAAASLPVSLLLRRRRGRRSA